MPMHASGRLSAKNFNPHARRIGNDGRHEIAADQPNVVLTDASHPKTPFNHEFQYRCTKYGKDARRFVGAPRQRLIYVGDSMSFLHFIVSDRAGLDGLSGLTFGYLTVT